jgi:hypothetical protein
MQVASRYFDERIAVFATKLAETDPPRPVKRSRVYATFYMSSDGIGMTFFATFALALAVILPTYGGGSIVSWLPITIFLLLAFGMLAGLPLFHCWRAYRGLRVGLRRPAEVTEIEPFSYWAGAGSKHGLRGSRVVDHPLAAFTDRFEYRCRWARQVSVGTRMDVLVDPQRSRVLLDLGPQRVAGAP